MIAMTITIKESKALPGTLDIKIIGSGNHTPTEKVAADGIVAYIESHGSVYEHTEVERDGEPTAHPYHRP